MAKHLFRNYPTIEYNLSGDGRDIHTIRNIMLRAKIRDSIKNNVGLYYDYPLLENQTPQEIAAKLYGNPNLFWIILMMNNVIDPHYDMGITDRQLKKYVEKKYPGTFYSVQSYTGDIPVGSQISGDTSGAIGYIIEWNPSLKKIVIDVKSGTFKLGEPCTTAKIRNAETLVGAVLLGNTTRKNVFAVHHYENTETGEQVDIEDYISLPVEYKREVDNYTYENEKNQGKKLIKLLRPEYVNSVVDEIEKILRN